MNTKLPKNEHTEARKYVQSVLDNADVWTEEWAENVFIAGFRSATVQSEDAPASYEPVTNDELSEALAEYRDCQEMNTLETNLRAAIDTVLYRRHSSLQAVDLISKDYAREHGAVFPEDVA